MYMKRVENTFSLDRQYEIRGIIKSTTYGVVNFPDDLVEQDYCFYLVGFSWFRCRLYATHTRMVDLW